MSQTYHVRGDGHDNSHIKWVVALVLVSLVCLLVQTVALGDAIKPRQAPPVVRQAPKVDTTLTSVTESYDVRTDPARQKGRRVVSPVCGIDNCDCGCLEHQGCKCAGAKKKATTTKKRSTSSSQESRGTYSSHQGTRRRVVRSVVSYTVPTVAPQLTYAPPPVQYLPSVPTFQTPSFGGCGVSGPMMSGFGGGMRMGGGGFGGGFGGGMRGCSGGG